MNSTSTIQELSQEYLTTKSLMVFLGGVSRDFVDDLRESGKLPYCKVGHTVFFRVKDVRNLIEKNRVY